MSLYLNDFVYVPYSNKYGKIVNILEGEDILYTVVFLWDFMEVKRFKGSQLTKLEELDFPLGSIVTGLKGAKRYNFTTDKAIMKVVAKKDGGRILVEIIQHEEMPIRLNSEHWVESRWFECIKLPSNFVR